MSGWDLTEGKLKKDYVSDDELWSNFNFVFSDSSRKRNTYKFGLIKALLDNLYNAELRDNTHFITYSQLFEKFTGNYWNLVIKYGLKQMRKDGKSEVSKIEQILYRFTDKNIVLRSLEFDSVDLHTKTRIVQEVSMVCRRNVVGALYNDTDGLLYSFALKDEGIYISDCAYQFMLKHKFELEKLNYFAWAKFLESINDDNVLIRLLDKLELATPRRNDLSIYRMILHREFEQDTCFYCGKKLKGVAHVDHFVPWKYIKSDNLWNFVLSCSSCNTKKNDRLPSESYLKNLMIRNANAKDLDENFVRVEFQNYSDINMKRLWEYAHLAGLKEYEVSF